MSDTESTAYMLCSARNVIIIALEKGKCCLAMSKQCEYTIITMFINELLFNIVIIIISICRLGSICACIMGV